MARSKTQTDQERLRLLAAVVTLYTTTELNQNEIAEHVGVGAGKISKLMDEARELGYLHELAILPRDLDLSAKLREMFSAKIPNPDAIVVNAHSKYSDRGSILAAVGAAAARHFEGLVAGMGRSSSVALDGGMAVASVIEALGPVFFRKLYLYPVAAGPANNPYTSVHALIGRFYGKYGAASGLEPHFLPTPTEHRSQKPQQLMQNDHRYERYAKTIEDAAKAQIFLLGVGVVSPVINRTMTEVLEFLGISVKSFRSGGVLGVAGYSAFNERGDVVLSPLDDKVFKIPGEKLKDAAADPDRHVIIVASETEKAAGLKVLVESGWCNCLVVDETTAEEMIKLRGGARSDKTAHRRSASRHKN